VQEGGFSPDSSEHEGDAVLLKERRQPWDVRLSSHTSCVTESRSCLALAVVAGIASSDEPVRGLADSCPSIFSIEIGNDRIRVPVA
jgi:hypothetical protein